MKRVEKTVFISYRHTNEPWALAIYQNLVAHSYDVFMDFSGLGSGDFEAVILANIRARAHFVVLLTPSALDRCDQPGDVLRLEIEAALESRRNIVPLMLEGFNFATPSIARQLTGKLGALKQYNALDVPVGYFPEAMSRLRDRYLDVPLEAVLHPPSVAAAEAARQDQMAAGRAAGVTDADLAAQQSFERGFAATDPDEQLRCYTESIRLKPLNPSAYYNRAIVHMAKGDAATAIRDYSEAIRLDPDDADAYHNRGLARIDIGDTDGALADYSDAIRLNPSSAQTYYNRGKLRNATGDRQGALEDYSEAIRLKPDYVNAYLGRGLVRRGAGDTQGALQDYSEGIRLNPENGVAYFARAVARVAARDIDGALEDCTQTLRLQPDESDALHLRGLLWETKGDYAAAIDDFEACLKLARDMPDAQQTALKERLRDLKEKM